MKVSREQAASNRERVLDAATRLFRERGFDGIGLADVMKDAGLTHGGFYGQFGSKEDLAEEVCSRSMAQSLERWSRKLETERGFDALLDHYLSERHRDHAGQGCTLPALGADVPRRGKGVRRAFGNGVAAMADLLAGALPGRLKAARRRKALASLASMVGAIVLARAVEDRLLSDEILEATHASLRSR